MQRQVNSVCLKILYQDSEKDFKFDSSATIEDLKLELYAKYKIKPSKQKILGWNTYPSSDSQELNKVLKSNETLILFNLDLNTYTEKHAAHSFKDKFEAQYGTNHVEFFTGSIDEALASCYDEEFRKILLIYLHNESDPFSVFFCNFLSKASSKHALDSNFLFLGLDSDIQFDTSALKAVISGHNDVQSIQQHISQKNALLFFVVPLEETNYVFTYLCGDIDSEDVFFTMIEASIEFAKLESSCIDAYGHGSRVITDESHRNAPRDHEKKAVENFVRSYEEQFGSHHVVFEQCSLQEALDKSCLLDNNNKKVFAFYFHNGERDFSKRLCPKLKAGEKIEKLLSEHCVFLPWDISDESNQTGLKVALDIQEEFRVLRVRVASKEPALFLVLSIQNLIKIDAVLSGKISEKEIITKINESVETLKKEMQDENDLNSLNRQFTQNFFTAEQFQQLMFDTLGDRDYDAFESAEHEYLKEKIGFAFFGQPDCENGYKKDECNKVINDAYEKICEVNDRYTEYPGKIILAVLYNVLEPLPSEKLSRAKKYVNYNPLHDINQQPIFVLKKCRDADDPCRLFIDHTLRVYESWNAYVVDNKLHECIMVLPKGGRYQGDEEGRVLLERHLSPRCSVSHKVLVGADVASTALGLASGGVFAASLIPAIPVAPFVLLGASVVGAGVGVYAIGRSIASLVDRSKHEENMSLYNPEARGAYINIVAGALGFVGAGANTLVSQLVANGTRIPQSAQMAVTTLNAINVGANGIGVANSTYDVIHQWLVNEQPPSMLTIVQLSSSLLFFGHAVYNFKSTTTLIEEKQASVISEIQESLRSNRHRKTFRKLELETIRLNNGDHIRARSDIIATIRKISDKNEIFAILTRSNKNFNKNNVYFAASKEGITLNGVPVDVSSFGLLSGDRQTKFLIDLPPRPAPSAADAAATRSLVNSVFAVDNVVAIADIWKACANGGLLMGLLNQFGYVVKEKLLLLVKYIIGRVKIDDCLQEMVNATLGTGSERIEQILFFVIRLCKMKMNEYEADYQRAKREEQERGTYDEEEFNRRYNVDPDKAKRAVQLFERSVFHFFHGGRIVEGIAKDLIAQLYDWLVELVYKKQVERERPQTARRQQGDIRYVACSSCNGKYLGK